MFGQITRYDTTLSFTNSSSYSFFDTTTVNVNSVGFYNGVFDGRYIYFVPFTNGQITRYDTTLPFSSAGSYSVFDTTTVSAVSKGFFGGVYDGKYIYFVPFYNGIWYFGQITRYDTTQSFTSAGSYAVFDLTTINSGYKGFQGGVFDGRYIYYIPCYAGWFSGVTVRYDTSLPFTSASSYSSFDITSVGVNCKSYAGGVFDGRYVWFVPCNYAANAWNGLVVKYDTTLSFTSASSYTVNDVTLVNKQ